MTEQILIHSFTLSGLGNAPFSHCPASHKLALKNHAFYCEHCGTQLKNRHFVISSDGNVHVVGIDCLRKTGDNGLIEAANQEIKEQKAKAKLQEHESRIKNRLDKERLHFKGKTKEETCTDLLAQSSQAEDDVIDQIDNLDITAFLSRSNFGHHMIELASGQNSFTKAMITTMVEISAKQLSNSRKNSQAFKTSLPRARELVKELTDISTKQNQRLEILHQKRIAIINTKII
jgi:hypothetical protein